MEQEEEEEQEEEDDDDDDDVSASEARALVVKSRDDARCFFLRVEAPPPPRASMTGEGMGLRRAFDAMTRARGGDVVRCGDGVAAGVVVVVLIRSRKRPRREHLPEREV